MPRLRFLSTAILASLIAVQAVSAKEIELSLHFPVDAIESTGPVAIRFKELVEKRLKGEARVLHVGSERYRSDAVALDAVIFGQIQLAVLHTSSLIGISPSFQLFDLPFLFKSTGAVERFQASPAGKKLLRTLEKGRLVGLGYIHEGMKQFSGHRGFRTPADMATLRILANKSGPLSAYLRVLGANPLQNSSSEWSLLLRSSSVDGQEGTWSGLYSLKTFTVQKSITESNHGSNNRVIVASAAFWHKLPNGQRTLIERVLTQAIIHGSKLTKDRENQDKHLIASAGTVEIVKLTNAQRTAWVDTARPIWADYKSEIGEGYITLALTYNSVW